MQWCQENQKKDTWEPLSHCMNSQLINQALLWLDGNEIIRPARLAAVMQYKLPLESKAKLCTLCVNYAQRYPWNAYLLHLRVLTIYMLTWFHLICCVLKPCVNLNYSCVHLLLSLNNNSKREGALKAGVPIVWYSHVAQALGNVGPRKLGVPVLVSRSQTLTRKAGESLVTHILSWCCGVSNSVGN